MCTQLSIYVASRRVCLSVLFFLAWSQWQYYNGDFFYISSLFYISSVSFKLNADWTMFERCSNGDGWETARRQPPFKHDWVPCFHHCRSELEPMLMHTAETFDPGLNADCTLTHWRDAALQSNLFTSQNNCWRRWNKFVLLPYFAYSLLALLIYSVTVVHVICCNHTTEVAPIFFFSSTVELGATLPLQCVTVWFNYISKS